jgi:hypothetical protein
MIRKNNEEEILRAFESMLRKKIKKTASIGNKPASHA